MTKPLYKISEQVNVIYRGKQQVWTCVSIREENGHCLLLSTNRKYVSDVSPDGKCSTTHTRIELVK